VAPLAGKSADEMQGTSADLPAGEKKCRPVNKDRLSVNHLQYHMADIDVAIAAASGLQYSVIVAAYMLLKL